eukprot:6658624-Pyramimonas_sp.AAC.1
MISLVGAHEKTGQLWAELSKPESGALPEDDAPRVPASLECSVMEELLAAMRSAIAQHSCV